MIICCVIDDLNYLLVLIGRVYKIHYRYFYLALNQFLLFIPNTNVGLDWKTVLGAALLMFIDI